MIMGDVSLGQSWGDAVSICKHCGLVAEREHGEQYSSRRGYRMCCPVTPRSILLLEGFRDRVVKFQLHGIRCEDVQGDIDTV